MTKKIIKHHKVWCPACGKNRGVYLMKEDDTYYIHCSHEKTLYLIQNHGHYGGESFGVDDYE